MKYLISLITALAISLGATTASTAPNITAKHDHLEVFNGGATVCNPKCHPLTVLTYHINGTHLGKVQTGETQWAPDKRKIYSGEWAPLIFRRSTTYVLAELPGRSSPFPTGVRTGKPVWVRLAYGCHDKHGNSIMCYSNWITVTIGKAK